MRESVEHTITFGKNRYHQQTEMVEWCKEHCGFGTWSYSTPTTWEGLVKMNWSVDSTFGNTTFAFRDPKHLTLFVLRWS